MIDQQKMQRQENWTADYDPKAKVLTIKVSLDPKIVDCQPSKSGKTMVYTSVQGGSVPDDPNAGLFLTVYRKEDL